MIPTNFARHLSIYFNPNIYTPGIDEPSQHDRELKLNIG